MTSHADRGHARLAPSAAHRWMNCPGSVKACEGIPDGGSAFADEGTAAHMLAETCLENGTDAAHYAGWWVDVPGGRIHGGDKTNDRTFEVDDEMVGGVQMYLDYVRAIFDKSDYYYIEQQLDCTHLHSEIWGTGDAIGYEEATEHLHVCDFKYGRGVAVEPQDNEQELIYASGAVAKSRKEGRPVRKITLHIVQPRAPHSDGPIRKWSLGANALTDFEEKVRVVAADTANLNAPLKAGEWCKFCRAAAICPERKRASLEAARIEFGADGAMAAPMVTSLDTRELGRLLSEIDQIEDWCRRVREYAHTEAGHGRVPDGWKLVAKRAVRKWKDEDAAAKALSAIFDLSDDQIFTRKLISPAGADKLVGKEGKAQLAKLYSKESSGTVLAPEDDPREAVRADPAVEFGEV